MMKAAFAPYRLHFIEPGGTSRGVMLHKDTYFLKIWDDDNPQIYGLGECALFKGLSAEDNDDYLPKLQELCNNISQGIATDLTCHSSIMFGFETALRDLASGGRRIIYQSPFVEGKSHIPINGLVWMGTKDQMLQRITQKINAGFRTIKLKIGAIDFDSELEMVKYIRDRFSHNELTIRVDANGGFSPDIALQRLEQLSKYHIHSCEQPIKQGQWQKMAEICAKSPIHIALDEELIGITNPMTMMSLLQTIRPHYIILKPSLMGGIGNSTDWLKMASMMNIGAWITSALESNVGLNALAQWVATLKPLIPQGLGTGAVFSNNATSPLEQINDYLCYNPSKQWQLPELDWTTSLPK
ncbi:MAG: o-succinylbenzoate synthase [Muribaculaceae bacterium]